MKTLIRKTIVVMTSLFFISNIFATESIVKNEHVQNQFHSTTKDQKKANAQKVQGKWQGLNSTQQQKAKQAENNRLHKIANDHQHPQTETQSN